MKKSDLPILSESLIGLSPKVLTGAASTIKGYIDQVRDFPVETTPKDAAQWETLG